MVMSSIKALDGGRVRYLFFITPFDVFAAPRNMSSMARTKRSGEITQPIRMPISTASHLVVQSFTVNFMKAELKYSIMILPTLLGKLKNSRAIRIKWCKTEPYALARLSQITCSSVLFLWAESIDFPYHLWMIQASGEARYLSLLDWCVYIMIAHQKGCHTTSKNSKEYFPFYI